MKHLLEPSELSTAIAAGRVVILDCRFDLADPKAGYRDYQRGHLPGALYADLEGDLSSSPGDDRGRHPLPKPSTLAAAFGRWGIDNRTSVVVYDAASGAFAARAWWLLRWLGHEDVRVLNGGLAAWRAAKLPIEQAGHEPSPVRYIPRQIRDDSVLEASDVLPFLEQGGVLLDARSPERFRGEIEPIDPVAGHVPGARNYCFSESLLEDGRFRPSDQLVRKLEPLLGGRAIASVAAMCGSGVTACHLLLALEVAGFGNAKLYAGSWSEWIRGPRRPVATGDT